MGTTYTAWDGNEYEWPPPKGWYQAIDNRWWAPDTGPMAMGEQAITTDSTMQMEQGSEIVNPAAVRQDSLADSELPAWARPKTSGTGVNTVGQDSSSPQSGSILLGLLLGAFALVAGVILLFALRGDDSDPNATATTETVETVETTETSQVETETSTSDTQTLPDVVIVVDEDAEEIFNQFLEENEIDPSNLDNQSHAEVVCNAVAAEPTPEGYVEVRSNFVSGTQREYEANDVPDEERLRVSEIQQLVDVSVQAFCPSLMEPLEIEPVNE